MSGTATVEPSGDALRQELGWFAVRQVPPNFAEAVERGDLAMLRWVRQNSPARALDEAVREWDGVCNHPGFADTPLPFKLDALNRCGIAHLERYLLNQNEADDSAARGCWERGLALAPINRPEHARFLHNQGGQMVGRYRRNGKLSELDAALPLLQAAVDSPGSESHLGLYLSSLGTALMERYQRQGALADLESAILYAERSLEIVLEDSPQRNRTLVLLGSLYRQRFEQTRNDGDIQRAILLLQESLRTASSLNRPFSLTNLGSALLNRYGHAGVRADLDRAVAVQREAVSLTPPGDRSFLIRLNNLANALSTLFAVTSDSWLLDEVVDTYQKVVQQTAANDPFRPSRLFNLGRTLQRRHLVGPRPADVQSGIEAFREACVTGLDYSLEWTLNASKAWGDWAEQRQNWNEAAEAYGYGTLAVDRLYDIQLLAESQALWLRDARDLASRAAYVQARNGHLDQAVVALEHGRARALNGALTRQEALREALPEADRVALRSLIERVDALRGEAGRWEPGAVRSYPVIVAELREAHRLLANYIEAVRAMFPQFMPQKLDFSALAALVATVGQPLIYLLTTPSGSLSLIVPATEPDQSPRVVPAWIDGFTSDDLGSLLNGRDDRVGYLRGSVEAEPEEFEVILDEVLPVLAERFMDSLASGLSALGIRRARIVPTGTLGMLPLHAAVPRDLVLSYVPSARALKAASLDAEHIGTPSCFLGVGDPKRESDPQLDFARLEVERIALLFTRLGKRAQVVPSAQATRAEINDLLAGATHLHFACHGRFDVTRPLNSALYLAGGETLTLQGLLAGELEVSALRLAVLSACQTGLIDFLNVPDEVVGFPAGFIQAGVPAVISTLWRVDDVSTAILLTRFYGYHLVDGMEPDLALHTAQQWLRTSTVADMDLAACYEAIFEASVRQDVEAFNCMAYYRAHPEERPFVHPFYWAAFCCTGK
jgi:CHAT domain-containing protein